MPSKTSRSSRPKERVSDSKGKGTQIAETGFEAGFVNSNQRMDEEEFRRFLEQLKVDVKIREEKQKEQTEYKAFLSRLKADVKMKEEMERKARSAEAAERKARMARAEVERRAKLEDERQARIACLEAERKAKQEEISAREAKLTIQHVGLDGSSLITCGAGMAVHNVLCGSDCCYVMIKNLPKDVKGKEVEDLFLQQGADRSAFCLLNIRQTDGKAEARVMMEAELGAVVVAGLHGSEFKEGHVLSFTLDSAPNKMGLSLGKNVNVLTVSWFLPSRIMIASYPTPLDAQNAVKSINTAFRGRGIRVELDQGRNKTVSLESSTSVKISGLPPEAESTEVQLHAGAIEIRMVKSPIYDLTVMHDTLKTQMEQMGLEAYDVRPANDEGKQKIVEVQARFSTWEQAKKAQDSLEGKRIRSDFPTLRTRLPKPHHYTISIPLRQYRAQKARWDSIANSEETKGTSVRVTENTSSERVIIQVSGEDRKVVGRLKVRIENLTSGENLDGALWHRSFATPAGRKFLDDIYSQMWAFVRSDWKTQTLKIYADGEARNTALGCIKAEIERLQSLEWSVLIGWHAVGFFMRRGLPVLKEILGDEAVSLELQLPCKLMIRGGGEEARRTVSELIKEAKAGIHPTVRDSKSKTCPICQDEVSAAFLLGCEHLYCDACLRHYITSAVGRKQFPLCCVGDRDRCKIPIAIPTIQKFLSPQSFSQLVEAAATTYIATQPDKFKYCDTPDCSQVYRCDGDRKSFTCPSCFVSVCIACKNASHEGMTCEEWTLLNDVSEQERRNLEWASAAGAKQCSRCQVFIQKIEGCNRVLCLCGAHICWICLASFSDSNSTYSHLNAVHGGVFDYEINE
ncbi:hypothetical protein APHAL10511_001548 [Amanita phalloides]|nr:hypothetical protein APHAL10511_001548 [Amanita phalloides]